MSVLSPSSVTHAENSPPLRLLGIFAHPDDETFCVGGTLAKYVTGGAEAMVVSFTRGEAGQIRNAALASRRTLGDHRTAELAHACEALGVQHVRCLDFGDGKLKSVPQETLVRAAVSLIREFRPHIVFTFDETGAYGHPDHIAVSLAATAACYAAGDPAQFPEQVAQGLLPHKPDRLYHSYFPQNDRLLLRLLVDWLRTLDTDFRGSDDFIDALLLFANESAMLGYARDHMEVQWYPKGFYIIEQGEPAISLYLILSGCVDVIAEDAAGNRRVKVTLGPGFFVGEVGLANGRPRNAHVVATENTTCLVFSPAAPTNFAGRGEDAQFAAGDAGPAAGANAATTCIDVSEFVQHKVTALSQHRTQFRVRPDMFPQAMLQDLLGAEYFVQVLPPKTFSTELLPGEPSHYFGPAI
jgi:LmbE family N-acetylglucosaminyl deacetylase